MTDTDIRAAIAAQRQDLVDLLAELPPARWDEPTLCAGWRVREVVAHITMPFRYSEERYGRELREADGDIDLMADRSARRDAAALRPEELLASLRDNVHHPWRPGSYEGALSHDVIHGLDITVALGIDFQVPEDRLRIVLGGMSPDSMGVKYFGVDLTGIQLRADDLHWSYGSGTVLTGAAQDLLLVVCGRVLPAGRLRGEPSARFTASSR